MGFWLLILTEMWHFSWFFACQISLKCQKCILLLPFFGPPPLLILFWDFARNTYSRGIVPLFLGSLYNLCTIKAVLLAPCNFKIQPLPKGGGPMNEATFGILRTINPKFDPTKDNRVKPFEVWCKLVSPLLSHTDCQKCTRSRPWQFYPPPVIKIGYPTAGWNLCTWPSFQASKWAFHQA